MAVKLVPMLDAAKFKVCVLVRVVVVPLMSATLPVRLLLLPLVVKSIEVPASRVVVPGTTKVPDWLIVPPEVASRLPLLFKVKAGRTRLAEAELKFKVKLRKAESELRLVGVAAAAFVLVRLKS